MIGSGSVVHEQHFHLKNITIRAQEHSIKLLLVNTVRLHSVFILHSVPTVLESGLWKGLVLP